MDLELKARIDEENCIGCSKCLRNCPTDAIIGSKHLTHTIVTLWCDACGKCESVCPTRCIEMQTLAPKLTYAQETKLKRNKILRQEKGKFISSAPVTAPVMRKQQIADAIARVKLKKSQK
ncbi:RnfABCDGE type electron transport complex subunit B [Orbaceae bacterium ac157xtp]